jgi:hypothetical protein
VTKVFLLFAANRNRSPWFVNIAGEPASFFAGGLPIGWGMLLRCNQQDIFHCSFVIVGQHNSGNDK